MGVEAYCVAHRLEPSFCDLFCSLAGVFLWCGIGFGTSFKGIVSEQAKILNRVEGILIG